MTILPQEAIDLLNLVSAAHLGLELAKAACADHCPACGAKLGAVMLYKGGGGYKPYDICPSETCEFLRRAS